MENKPGQSKNTGGRHSLSRREVLVGAATAALVAGTSSAMAVTRIGKKVRVTPDGAAAPVMRYMAAAAPLGDGRILLTGGYTRAIKAGDTPMPVNTAVIFDPWTGEFTPVAPMLVPRARHAAVSLKDGRVAVIGGMSGSPTASIEVYDSGRNAWTKAKPLAQPRYDHTAATDGETIFVMGGSSLNMLTGIEAVHPG